MVLTPIGSQYARPFRSFFERLLRLCQVIATRPVQLRAGSNSVPLGSQITEQTCAAAGFSEFGKTERCFVCERTLGCGLENSCSMQQELCGSRVKRKITPDSIPGSMSYEFTEAVIHERVFFWIKNTVAVVHIIYRFIMAAGYSRSQ